MAALRASWITDCTWLQALLTRNPRNPWRWTADQLSPPEVKELTKEIKGLVVRCLVRLIM